MPKYKNGQLFGNKSRNILYGALRRSCANVGIKYLPTYQPGRHSFATSLHQNEGWYSRQIADVGGWKSPRVVDETYIHINEPAKKAAELIGKKPAKTRVENF